MPQARSSGSKSAQHVERRSRPASARPPASHLPSRAGAKRARRGRPRPRAAAQAGPAHPAPPRPRRRAPPARSRTARPRPTRGSRPWPSASASSTSASSRTARPPARRRCRAYEKALKAIASTLERGTGQERRRVDLLARHDAGEVDPRRDHGLDGGRARGAQVTARATPATPARTTTRSAVPGRRASVNSLPPRPALLKRADAARARRAGASRASSATGAVASTAPAAANSPPVGSAARAARPTTGPPSPTPASK